MLRSTVRRFGRSVLAATLAGVVTLLMQAGGGNPPFGVRAFACIAIPRLTLAPNAAQPGSTVTATVPITAMSPASAPTVTLHAGTPDGSLLGQATAGPKGTTITFNVPADASGVVDVVAVDSQPACGMPARAPLLVSQPGGALPTMQATTMPPGQSGLTSEPGLGIGTLALIGLGGALAGLLVAWLVHALAGRRNRTGALPAAGGG